MDCPEELSVLDYYARFFRPGMTDLSASSPPRGAEAWEGRVDYGPPGGLPELRRAVADLYAGVRAEDVIVTNGASEALAATAFALVQAGDTVSAGRGIYPSFREVARRLGATVKPGDAGRGHCSLIVVNNPSVPDGRLVDLRPVLAEAESRGARVVSDEVHLDLRGAHSNPPAASLSPTAVSVGDLSKPLGLGGLRIGWVVCRDPVALEAIGRAVQILSGGPSVLAMEFAVKAMAEYGPRLADRCAAAARNSPGVFAALREAGWRFEAPEAGWTLLAVPPEPLGADRLERMRRNGCFLVPASAFGAGEGYRISVFAPLAPLRRTLQLPDLPCGPADGGVVVLTKAPLPGFSKTRLAEAFGPAGAARLAGAFLDDTLQVARSTGHPVDIAFAPANAREEMARRAPVARLLSQPEGDLGTRIRAALSAAVEEHGAAILIGSDTPHLSRESLLDAFECLAGADLVVGPSTDGGFYLLGSSLPVLPARLFEDITWSSSAVFSRLFENARASGLRVHVLSTLTDIDDGSSFRTVLDSIGHSLAAPATKALAAQLGLELFRDP